MAGMAATTCVELDGNTAIGVPFQRKVVLGVKPLPAIVRLKEGPPAGVDAGDRLVRLKVP